jgi:cell division protein FtsA
VSEIVVGIDIGTSKVCTVIGRVARDGQVEILGKGMETCTGVKKGIIVDIESTARSIRNSVDQAESMADMKVVSAHVNIAGLHVSVINNRNSMSVSGDNREVTRKDVERLLYTAGSITIPEDRQIIDVIPRQFILDGYDEIIDPAGMVGVKLEADVDVITGKITSVQNILKSMERAGIKIEGLVVEALGTSEIVVSMEEKDMGCILIDIGGGTTDISVFKNKKMIFYDSLPVGGDHITNDISIGLKILYTEAERVKREYELALTTLIKNDQEATVSDLSDNRKKTVKVSEIVEIIEARVYEIFSLCNERLQKAGVTVQLGAGVILSGAGISYVDGGMQLAYEVFDLPIRVASHKLAGISKIEFATAAGIVKYISLHRKNGSSAGGVKVQQPKGAKRESGLFKRVSRFFSEFFFLL